MDKKPSAYQLAPQDRIAVQHIQDHLESTMGKIPMRAAISWAINQAYKIVQREERKAKYMAEVK